MAEWRGRVSWRVGVWVFHLVLPLLGLWLLVAQPEFDVHWEHHGAHFALVAGTAGASVVLGALIAREAGVRRDARLLLVAGAFITSAGFLGLHALATPGIILDGPNAGFVAATPVGLGLAAVFALASSAQLDGPVGEAVVRHRRLLWAALTVVLLAWLAVSLSGRGPLGDPLAPTEAHGRLVAVAVGGSALYIVAALRYLELHHRRPSVVLLSILTAFILLAESLVAVAWARNWQASWWLWHLLMTLAFAFVAYAARVQYEREGSASALFGGITLDQTALRMREEYETALEELVAALARRADSDGGEPLGPVLARLAARFRLSDPQVNVLERGAEALAAERTQARRLAALVAVGNEASVIRPEDDLLGRVDGLASDAFRPERVRVGLIRGDRLVYAEGPAEELQGVHAEAVERLEPVDAPDGDLLVLPLVVKGHAAGVLEVRRPPGEVSERDRSVLRSFASQVSIALENARLYQQLDGLFRSYMSPDVATALLADPSQANLGGTVAEVSVLMADLQGFTPFSERTAPEDVVAMLNSYWGVVVPVILAEGGTVVQFVGDAVMALFGAPVDQPDQAVRAGRAGLALQREAAAAAPPGAGWPRFRVGINSGPALVGNVGTSQFRNFTAIGDTTNLAARLEATAPPGGVVIGERTRELLGEIADVRALGPVELKGKGAPVHAFVLEGLRV